MLRPIGTVFVEDIPESAQRITWKVIAHVDCVERGELKPYAAEQLQVIKVEYSPPAIFLAYQRYEIPRRKYIRYA